MIDFLIHLHLLVINLLNSEYIDAVDELTEAKHFHFILLHFVTL